MEKHHHWSQMNNMNRKGSIRFFWLGIAILFLVGSLITPIKKATATSIREQQGVGEITVSPTSGLITTEAGGTDTFTVVLSSQPTEDVTIGMSSSDSTEGTVSPTSLTFTIGDWSIEQTVTVTGVNDQVADGPINYDVIT